MDALVTEPRRKTPARLAGSAVLACQSDNRLVALTRDGHERAFEAIVDRYRRPLLRHCRRILPESRAEDAVQQTFLNAHTALMDSDDELQLKPWLYTIARNVSLNMLRQNGWNYEQIPLDFDGVRRPDQVFEQRIELQQTVSAMNELPERQRSALVMRELEGRSYTEIGAALGANDGAVRQLLNRARVTLRSAATALMPPPLVARFASAPPPDGRRIVEIAGGLGAAGIAKVGATALIAGTLVVGAAKAPLLDHDKPHAKATAATTRHRSAAQASAAAVAAAIPIAKRVSSGSGRSGTSGHHGSGNSGHGSDDSSSHSGSGRSGSDDGGSSGSGSGGSGDSRSGSSDDGSRSGTSGGTGEHSGSGTSGSGDSSSGSGSGTSGGSDDATQTATSGGSTESGSGTSGSGETQTVESPSGSGGSGSSDSGSGSSGSGSSGSGSDDVLSGTSGDR